MTASRTRRRRSRPSGCSAPRRRLGRIVGELAFWRGFASGLYSTRHSIFATFPRSGVPPAFRDYGEFATLVGALERSGALDDYTRIWWDLRPHPRLGTVEVRAMDAVERLDDAVALAAYVQALAKRAVESPAPPSCSRTRSCAKTNGRRSATG